MSMASLLRKRGESCIPPPAYAGGSPCSPSTTHESLSIIRSGACLGRHLRGHSDQSLSWHPLRLERVEAKPGCHAPATSRHNDDRLERRLDLSHPGGRNLG